MRKKKRSTIGFQKIYDKENQQLLGSKIWMRIRITVRSSLRNCSKGIRIRNSSFSRVMTIQFYRKQDKKNTLK